MLKSRETAQKSCFQFRHDQTHALLTAVEGEKFLLHGIAQFAEVRSANRAAHGNEHVLAGLVIGCLNAGRWVAKEDKAMRDEQEDDDE